MHSNRDNSYQMGYNDGFQGRYRLRHVEWDEWDAEAYFQGYEDGAGDMWLKSEELEEWVKWVA